MRSPTLWSSAFSVLVVSLVVRASLCEELNREVTFGSLVKLRHERLKINLHSHEVSYGSGSGQQSVTGFNGGDDSNDYWQVKCALKAVGCLQGQAVNEGDLIRLQHMATKKWLHSHLHQSPLSGNYEVSGYGSESQSDTGDHWKVEIEGSGTVWRRDQRVRFLHKDIQAYLHCHNMQYGRPISGQFEVCATQRKTPESIWMATEGVYLPVRKE